MEFLQQILSICGAVSIVGGAGAIIVKVIKPAFVLTKRVSQLEVYNDKDYNKLQSLEEMQKQQSKCLAAMLNHQITGNGIDEMKKIRDELLENIIEKYRRIKYEYGNFNAVCNLYADGNWRVGICNQCYYSGH